MKTIDDLLVGTKYEPKMVPYDREFGLAKLLPEGAMFDMNEDKLELDAKKNAVLASLVPGLVEALRFYADFGALGIWDETYTSDEDGEKFYSCRMTRPYGVAADALKEASEVMAIVGGE